MKLHVVYCLPALVGVLGETHLHQTLEGRRRQWLDRRERLWFSFQYGGHHVHRVRPLESFPSCGHFVEDRTQGEDV